MKKPIYLLIAICCLSACHESQNTSDRLGTIDSLLTSGEYGWADTVMAEINPTFISDAENRAHYYLLQTQLKSVLGKTDTTCVLDSMVIPHYERTANHEKLAEAYYYKGYYALRERQLSEAARCYKQAEELARSTTNSRLQYKVAESLAYINEISGNQLLHLDYARKALEIAKAEANREWMAHSYHSIALAYSGLGQNDSMVHYINQAAQLRMHIARKDRHAFLANIAYTYKYSQPEIAKKYFLEALAEKESSIILEHLANIYYAEGSHDEAYRLWKRALAVDDDNPKDVILHNILEYDVAHGRMEDVCKKVNDIITIKDSILNKLKNDTIKDLQFRFDHEVAMRQQEQIAGRWQTGMLVTLLLATLLTASIIINRYRTKNRIQEIQLQINDLMNQKRELKESGEKSAEAVLRLNKKIHMLLNKRAKDLKEGSRLYDHIKSGGTIVGWTSREKREFIKFYSAINYSQVRTIKDTRRKQEPTVHHLFFLILLDMGFTDVDIARILGISDTSVATLHTRTKPID